LSDSHLAAAQHGLDLVPGLEAVEHCQCGVDLSSPASPVAPIAFMMRLSSTLRKSADEVPKASRMRAHQPLRSA
jgi:hypothetical protein